MPSDLHWLTGPWVGKLALEARPRGGDWLPDEVAKWKHAGVGAVLSLLTADEERDLNLRDESKEVRARGLDFLSFPIADRQVPTSETRLGETLERLHRFLSAGKNVVVHCRQGVGRTGLVAACLLVKNGMSPGAAVEAVTAARGVATPETPEQRDWIERYAPVFTK